MAAVAVLTTTIDPTAKGTILTFITPATQGCGMACGYCFIDRRGEETRMESLQPEDYSRFIREAADQHQIAAVTIQGREPLAPSSMRWTKAILETGASVGAETGIVTNGLWLQENSALLGELDCSGVTVSIDADSAVAHDRLRRAPGAWERAMDGLRTLTSQGGVARIAVNSLYFKNGISRLLDLPDHLAQAGVKLWSISPMLRYDKFGQPHASVSNEEWIEAIDLLSQRAARYGVSVVADDEFEIHEGARISSAVLRILSRPSGIMRMQPDGRCSFGKEILKSSSSSKEDMFWMPDAGVAEIMGQMNR
ncbi:radical SAM protein [Parasphingorhabdus sp.]|uniref:radical SAM protein n=1 Tax=Parasphingorhabdus sp. TaxID=2709688 RepID=UPI003593A957